MTTPRDRNELRQWIMENHHGAPLTREAVESIIDYFIPAASAEPPQTDAEGESETRGPESSECITLDKLLDKLNQWKAVLSGRTCVSFERLCAGGNSLWHQTHRENFRKIDRKPEELSRWVLEHAGRVRDDFPAQVLAILVQLKHERKVLAESLMEIIKAFGISDGSMSCTGPELLVLADDAKREAARLTAALREAEERAERAEARFKIIDHEQGRVSYQVDRIREHFDKEGNIKGDGKWRVDEIGKCCRLIVEAGDEAVKSLNELAENGCLVPTTVRNRDTPPAASEAEGAIEEIASK